MTTQNNPMSGQISICLDKVTSQHVNVIFSSVYMYIHVYTCIYIRSPLQKTGGKEHATSTQLIKMAKARHLAGVTIFRCSMYTVYVATPTACVQL